jgi:16S rRNA (guanine1207-N2)-methyltransferase
MATNDALDTLFHPVETGELDIPTGRALFVRAQAHAALARFAALDYLQDFYPAAQGLTLSEQLTPPYDAALVLASKDKTEAQYDLARALDALTPGGWILASAANDAGGARLESWFAEMGLTPQSYAKNKCRAVWAVKGEEAITPFEWLMRGERQRLDLGDGTYWTQAGLFGWNKIDSGSALLADHLPAGLTGTAADFGCGYGFLSAKLLQKNPGLFLTAIDADKRAVDCTLLNCAGAHGVWRDLTQPWDGAPFDHIVMNPPFHMGKFTDSDIGVGFIKTAAAALNKGGWLYMVANRHLPYESVLSGLFVTVKPISDKNGFKVIFAQK